MELFSHNKETKQYKNVLYYKTGDIFFAEDKNTGELYSYPEYSPLIKEELYELCDTLLDDEWYDYKLIEKITNK